MKTLRLTFAMGGGVSLGSFSGAALTEILKALVLDGRDYNGYKYDKIVLDSMSGASAGAIALAILMKSLMDYKNTAKSISKHYLAEKNAKGSSSDDFYRITQKSPESPEQSPQEFLNVIEEKVNKLIQEVIESDAGNSTSKEEQKQFKETLVAIEIAQILQEIIWVKEVNIQRLLKSISPQPNIENFSLLPRDTMVELTKKYLFPGDENVLLDNLKVLGERVIFACSLTNLVPNKIVESVDGINLDRFPQIRETKKALNSKSHKELRVFDFKFKPAELGSLDTTESNWLELSPNPKIDKNQPLKLNLKSKEAWAKIAASVIACGAFPIAFAPVILKRWRAEFPQYTKDLEKKDKAANNKKQYNSIWELPGVEAHKLPYVDGGTFNNEPVREAFKLANYIDTNLRRNTAVGSKPVDFDRLVVFVDPIVDTGELSYNMNSYSKLTAGFKKGSLHKIQEQTAFAKASTLSSHLIGMLHNQGAIKEEHKISDYLSKVRLKARMFAHLSQLNIPLDNSLEELDLFREIVHHVQKNLRRGPIPFGTRDIGTYLFWTAQAEFNKRWTEGDIEESKQNSNNVKALWENALFEKIGSKQMDKLAELLGLEKKSGSVDREKKLSDELFTELAEKLTKPDSSVTEFEPLFKEIFAKHTKYYEPLSKFIKLVFFNIAIDAALDLDGKDPKAIRLAVTPVSYPTSEENKDAKTIDLPGAEIQAFGGSFSLASRKYAFNYGRYCALKTLKSSEARSYYAALRLDPTIDPDVKQSPFVKNNSFTKSLSEFRRLLGKSSEKNLTQELKDDFYNLKNDRIIRPVLSRIFQIFPSLKRGLIANGVRALLFFILIFIGILLWHQEKTTWTTSVSISFGISALAVAVTGLTIYKLFVWKKEFKNYVYEQISTFPNFEVTVLFPAFQENRELVKAVRINNNGRYIKTIPFTLDEISYTAIKLFIRQTEKEGNNKKYHLYAYHRALRNWDLSPFNAFEKSLNQNENDLQKINCIDLTTKSWLSRLLSFSNKSDASIDLESKPLDVKKIEQLKFFIDPAIIAKTQNETFFFNDYRCLARELEELILTSTTD